MNSTKSQNMWCHIREYNFALMILNDLPAVISSNSSTLSIIYPSEQKKNSTFTFTSYARNTFAPLFKQDFMQYAKQGVYSLPWLFSGSGSEQGTSFNTFYPSLEVSSVARVT